ncbi:Formyl transferase [Saccharicrinis carchari]|uniref:Formyl transferase n=1 Tax=Saccharicrinis carchari TaxID=1168039 RepID=A0A521AKQ5_SACCC|nr:dTDP-4-amino-4,6-dideoxyglucose formyltransferase [Saccharicrinis carchari]SMO35399.1 Formyl transferase [Saccharicrinis carchari]
MKSKYLVVTDNGPQYKAFIKMLEEKFPIELSNFDFKKSAESKIAKLYEEDIKHLEIVNVKEDYQFLIDNYSIIFSLHCKQIFPKELVTSVKCINIHPGYNPINRGWYPQVFAINYNLPIGATIHEMDELVDHGGIIDRQLLEIKPWETSKEVYENILKLEIDLIEKNLLKILDNAYTAYYDKDSKENFFTRQAYKNLCEINLNETVTYGDAINRLRALSHGKYSNAYFIDEKTKEKIFLNIVLKQTDQ